MMFSRRSLSLGSGLHHDFATDNVDRLRHFEHQMSPFNPAGTLGIVVVKRRTDNVGVAFMDAYTCPWTASS
jgi:hypothetical protein